MTKINLSLWEAEIDWQDNEYNDTETVKLLADNYKDAVDAAELWMAEESKRRNEWSRNNIEEGFKTGRRSFVKQVGSSWPVRTKKIKSTPAMIEELIPIHTPILLSIKQSASLEYHKFVEKEK